MIEVYLTSIEKPVNQALLFLNAQFITGLFYNALVLKASTPIP